MEYIAGGHLSQQTITALTLPARLRLFRDIVAGVAVMHGRGIRHGDLKPEQILLTAQDCNDPSCVAKVSDFGSSCLLNEVGNKWENRKTVCGGCTPEFEAPERWLHNETTFEPLHPPTLENDRWALGAILYEMVMQKALIKAPWGARFKDFTVESREASENTLNISKAVAGRVKSLLALDVGLKLVTASVVAGIGETVGGLVAGLLHIDPASRTELAEVQTKLAEALKKLDVPSDISIFAAQVPACFQACITHEPKCEKWCALHTPGKFDSLVCM
jgi:serine/threonine protein kinase